MTSYTQNPFRIKKKKTINHFSTESYRHENPSRKIIPAYNVFHQKKKQHFFPLRLKFQRFVRFIDRVRIFVAIPMDDLSFSE